MKKSLKHFIALSLAALLLVLSLFGTAALAERTQPVPPSEHDQELLTAFWHQPAHDGMNNGEAVYYVELGEGDYLDEDPGEYGGGYDTRLLFYNYYVDGAFELSFNYHLLGSVSGQPPEVPVQVYPDLYGELDLRGTYLQRLFSPRPGQTHITKVNLDGCWSLYYALFDAQPECTEFSAVGGVPYIMWLSLRDGAFEKIAFDRLGYEAPVRISAFGNGCIGAFYNTLDNEPDFENAVDTTLYAYPKADTFVGWFENGVCVSEELEYVRTEGGTLTACFGGDANGDGAINVSDALLALRASMGLFQSNDEGAMMDVNGNGTVDVSDAIMILRFAMGII